MTPRFGLRAPHERTLESLYRRHAADVYRYALMMLDSPADAEDVTQTTFLNAYRALTRGERPRATSRWLRSIAHNLCLQHFRQASRRPREVELEDDAAADLVTEPQGLLVDELSRALRQIPVNQRAALLMRELEGRPIAEIADILGVSTSAVETLLFRARRGVREQLEGGLTCAEAERAISLQLDGQLKRSERGALRAHLRECEECAHLARSLRAQRGAIKSLATIPLPAALAWSKFGAGATTSGVAGAGATGIAGVSGAAGGSAAATGGTWLAGSLASKLVGAALLAAVGAGVSYVAAVKHPWTSAPPGPKAPVRVAAARTPPSPSAARSGTVVSTHSPIARIPLGSVSRAATGTRRFAATKASHAHRHASAERNSTAAPAPGTQRSATGTSHGGVNSSVAHQTQQSQSKPSSGTTRRATAKQRTKAKHASQAHPIKPTPATKPAVPVKPIHTAPRTQTTATTTTTTTTP